MDLISKERDRLLQRAARVWGLSFTVVSLICFVLPGATPERVLVVAVPLYVVLGVFQAFMGWMRPTLWALLSVLTGIVVVGHVFATTPPTPAGQAALVELCAAAIPAAALVLLSSWWRIVLLVLSFAAVGIAVELTTADLATALRTGALVVVGWALPALVGAWIMAAVPQAAKRIASIGRAHRAERQASELEAQRRQGARLLHDTVLATLTLLAHSGVGVSPEALREQASDDARLLRQLRLGTNSNVPDGSVQKAGTETSPVPVAVEEPVLGTTLASVKQRFGRMGLQVSWHGAGQVLLPSHTLDAFLLALAECLENVRRHSGVTEAHVTITDDDTTVRAMVTDSGVGFDIADIEATKLGFTESVVGRLREVGGTARLFSAPGSGTTVVLEVPRAEVGS